MKEKWIQEAGMKKGGLHRATHTPIGKTIPSAKVEQAAHSRNPHMQHMGQAALNMEGMSHTGHTGMHPVAHLMAKVRG